VPRQKGMVLTERDRALLGYLGVARYVTGAQAHRLLAPGHDKAITSRRLARLCELGPNPGDDAYLRRLEYRRSNSLPFPVWTLTPHGRALAEPIAPGPVAAVQPGVGIHFIERILALNELLIALILAARRSESAPLTDLPFRWLVADQPLRFEIFDRVYMTRRPAVLRPGAVIDLPRTRNRIFLEPELGTTSLAPADPRQGHVKRRLERYTDFFLSSPGRDMKQTWYGAAFPDGYYPEVIALARTEARRAKVERHIKDWFQGGDSRYALRAFTFAGAKATLTPLVAPAGSTAPHPAAAAPAPAPASSPPIPLTARVLVIDEELRRRLKDGIKSFVGAYNSLRKQASDHAIDCPNFRPDPGPTAELSAFRDLIWHDVLGKPREPAKDRKP
jgi:hypothetical protein